MAKSEELKEKETEFELEEIKAKLEETEAKLARTRENLENIMNNAMVIVGHLEGISVSGRRNIGLAFEAMQAADGIIGMLQNIPRD